MTLKEMKKTVLALIEELNPDSEYLTDDPDIQAKINDVINLVQLELARMKKIADVTTEIFEEATTYKLREKIDRFYQLKQLRFKTQSGDVGDFEIIDDMVMFNEAGHATIFYYKMPQPINADTQDEHELEISQDALGIMPYGVAADILKSDVSANYGQIYKQRYEEMLQRLDPRYNLGSVVIEGGVDF